MTNTRPFEGKSVLITGAGKGIGRQTAIAMFEKGASVFAMSRTQDDLDSLSALIDSTSVLAELSRPRELRKVCRSLPVVDYLVNCAGVNVVKPFLETTDELFEQIWSVNTRAAMIISQEYVRTRLLNMETQFSASGRYSLSHSDCSTDNGHESYAPNTLAPGGAIVNVSSISSFFGFTGHAAYCSSKGAMDGLSRVMANELGQYGIRVNSINPGITLTELAAQAWGEPGKVDPMMARTPLQRFARPEEVAEVICFLLSNTAGMINGITLPMDGGFMVR